MPGYSQILLWKRLQPHTGRHPEIIARMVSHPAFGWWIQNAHRTFIEVFINWSNGTIVPAVVFCRSGRHGAVAASEILKGVSAWVEGWEFAPTIHMSIDIERAGCTCRKCHSNRLICESIQSSITSAVAVLQSRESLRGSHSQRSSACSSANHAIPNVAGSTHPPSDSSDDSTGGSSSD